MKGAAESKENVIIDHQLDAQFGKPSCTIIQFFNVSSVNVTTLTMRCPAINLKESHITVKSSNLYGYPGIQELTSVINITGRGSQALLDNCTFKENCFIQIKFCDGIVVSNSTFQSYRHQFYSIIEVYSSIVTLTGNVNFTDSITGVHPYGYASSGTAVFLQTTPPELKSSLNITYATVHFVNLTSNSGGGAVAVENGVMHIDAKAKVVLMHNTAYGRGAVYILNGTLNIRNESNVIFAYNEGTLGGAMLFTYGTMCIDSTKSVKFIMNTGQVQGGAIYIDVGDPSSIIVNNSAKLFFLSNSAFQGGALYVIPSSFAIMVGYQSSIQFVNNTAFDVGGAMYAEMQPAAPCLFMIADYSAEIPFIRNHANYSVGHHMYGTSIRDRRCEQMYMELAKVSSKPYCWYLHDITHEHINISFFPGLNETLSPVSSAPQHVCLCDSNGKPQCVNNLCILTNVSVYCGETFTLSLCIVGYDFGTTVGVVHAGFLHSICFTQLGQLQDNQLINNSENCTNLKYTLLTKCDAEMLQLQASVIPVPAYVTKDVNKNILSHYKSTINRDIADYFSHDNGCLRNDLLTTPVFINITLLPGCPPGLTLNHDQTTCSCYPILANSALKCLIQNKTSTMWVNATFNGSHSTGIINNHFCPLEYCKSGNKTVNIGDDSSKQCSFNRTGILCGACKENFSLAIGSSRCIACPNSHNMALLLAFAAAGIFLVFFILALNLTVTQGFVNGVIFYANIIGPYKTLLFPSQIQENHWPIFLNVFVAWLNLDFGIETCLFFGLDTYWTIWLQFLFPFYIWAIAGVIIVACHYSSHLTNLIGSRAVPLLATLFLLSYMKLLRIVIDAISVAVIAQYPQNISYVVWYLDGNLRYCQHPHIYLFIAAIATLVFLWLLYTLLLFIQPLRRVSHLRLLKWINKLAPVYDAYFSPLKVKHQYWFGTMLLVRSILMVILATTSQVSPELNIFVLFLFTAFLLFFMSVKYVYMYKRMNLRLLESAILLNLLVLSAANLYKWESSMIW